MTTTLQFEPGSLIHARGREWVVLPESTDDLILARPVGGLDEETAGILPAIEPVQSSSFPLPTRADLGDAFSGRLLRDAARLSTRAAAGPFRSLGRIAVEPRPYQLVPLIMALKLDPVRLLIADDVGIGKTVEAALIARELLDRGEVRRFTVLCPPHLAEQWQLELSQKFHIEAELILSGTIQRLERDLPLDVSVFDRYPFTVVSTDFIKTPRRAEDFVLKCPELVIVDEAHGCTVADGSGRARQQRFELLRRIASDESRHLILVTATPHSGKEQAFRSLLSLLRQEFADLPLDLDARGREGIRRKLARHLVQRRRADIRHYLEADTAFPERRDKVPEPTYSFSEPYRKLFNDILNFVEGYVADEEGSWRHRRVRYWSALALLRCVSSSPAAAAATLRTRAAVDAADDEAVEEVGRRTVLDQDDADDALPVDFSPGSDTESASVTLRRRLLEFARRAESITPRQDNKLQGAIAEIRGLLDDGFQPVVFCRFVDTAQYVAKHLHGAFKGTVRVEAVTGTLPPAEREARIQALVSEPGPYVLVATDCLAEGINLQDHFNAVLHYDLAWNPTRHEQREGRVDRFGQKSPQVRVVTYYGKDNPIDKAILDVFIRKHKRIKSDLGITVTVPKSSEEIAETLFETARRKRKETDAPRQMVMPFVHDLERKRRELHREWDNARDREKASRSRFAQHTLDPETVARELRSVREAIGRSQDVARFFRETLQAAGIPHDLDGLAVRVHLSLETPRSLRQALGLDEPFTGRFELPVDRNEIYLARTSPVIEGLAGWVLDQALDPSAENGRRIASRLGVLATSRVERRTTLLIIRFRYQMKKSAGASESLLCEEVVPMACTGPSDDPVWLPPEEAEALLDAVPERNLPPTAVDQQASLAERTLPKLRKLLASVAYERAEKQRQAHERVRETVRASSRIAHIEPVLPADILGTFILLPR
jgi:superfamily II DNA or RNA helicase